MNEIFDTGIIYISSMSGEETQYMLYTHKAFYNSLAIYGNSIEDVLAKAEQQWRIENMWNIDPVTGLPIDPPPFISPDVFEISLTPEQLIRFNEIKNHPGLQGDDVNNYVGYGTDGTSLAFLVFKMNKAFTALISRVSALELNHQ